jgi:hypothetical protein
MEHKRHRFYPWAFPTEPPTYKSCHSAVLRCHNAAGVSSNADRTVPDRQPVWLRQIRMPLRLEKPASHSYVVRVVVERKRRKLVRASQSLNACGTRVFPRFWRGAERLGVVW